MAWGRRFGVGNRAIVQICPDSGTSRDSRGTRRSGAHFLSGPA